jgi:pantoate--beta-alanine ligase
LSADAMVFGTIAEIRAAVAQAKREGKFVGLVPTMGALHTGHERLIEACRSESGYVVVSIFVNPTQFGPNEDYARYPRTFEADRACCVRAGVDAIFAPSVDELYPSGGLGSSVDVPALANVLEGQSRPGHFRGVATVVLKLFNIVQPDVAYFGEKDFQQLQVIRRMCADLDCPVAIRGAPTVREPDGLAMSSRNRFLNPEERRAAAVLSRAVGLAREAVGSGETDADRVRQILRRTLESEGLVRVDYAEVADAQTLAPLAALEPGRSAVALVAVRIGPVRLIDNGLLPG